jgi:flagellar basal-body rod protein FlgG
MINSLQIAKTGMQAQQTQLDVISHNLANVSTSGFKRGTAIFEDLIYQNLRQVGANAAEQAELPTGLQLGLGVRTVATARTYTQGNLQQTGNNLDLAVNGDGFFQVGNARRHHRLQPRRQFQDHRRRADGQQQRLPAGGGHHRAAECAQRHHRHRRRGHGRAAGQQHADPAGHHRTGHLCEPGRPGAAGMNLFTETAASGAPNVAAPGTDGRGQTLQGYLESSNVNVVQELVTMIQTQRAYEMNSKAIQTSDQMLQRLSQL